MLAILIPIGWLFWRLFERLHKTRHFYQYLFFCRFPLLAGLALTLLPVLAVTVLDDFIGNWFADIGLLESSVTIFFVLLSARTLCYLVQLVFLLVPHRTRLDYLRRDARGRAPQAPESYSWPQACIRWAMAVPCAAWTAVMVLQSERPGQAALGLPIGGAAFAACFLLFRWTALTRRVDRVGELLGGAASSASRVAAVALEKARIAAPKKADAAAEHARAQRNRAILFGALFLALYAAGAVVGNPEQRWPEAVPLPVYPILILTLLALLLTWLSSRVDSRRFPASLLALAWPFVLYGACDTDHEYALRRPAGAAAPAALGEKEFAAAWMRAKREAGVRVPVIVTSSGGGISAAYWTASVLDHLRGQEEFGEAFAHALLATSTVSGGSAGAAFWLQEYGPDGPPTRAGSARAVARAGSNSLSAVAWGLAYPDTLRLFAPILAKDRHDRGWALETAWERAGLADEATLLQWRSQAAAALRPTSIFNATLMESGQRLQIAVHDPTLGERRDGASAQSWLDLYPGWDLRIGTAARLSSTFPYVAPVSRPAWAGAGAAPAALPEGRRYHVADGGYYDNDGVASAIEFLREALPVLREQGAEALVLVRIRASPIGPMPEASGGAGWNSALLGPLYTMLGVRTASQVDRNRSQLDAMLESWRGPRNPDGSYPFPIYDAVYELQSEATLSWILTEGQKAAIRADLDLPPHAGHAAEIARMFRGDFGRAQPAQAR